MYRQWHIRATVEIHTFCATHAHATICRNNKFNHEKCEGPIHNQPLGDFAAGFHDEKAQAV